LQRPCGPVEADVEAIQNLMKKQNIENVLYTLGPAGSIWIEPNQHYVQKPLQALANVANTVGAGDAYCAGVLAGLIQNWTPKKCLTLGTMLAEAICHVPGATSHDPGFYKTIDCEV
jgi:sugar/nucleoside kinase (ribokinase family)